MFHEQKHQTFALLHSSLRFSMSIASGEAISMMMAKTPKHHPEPAASARGCCAAPAAPAPRHRTKLYDTWTVAEAWGLRSVRSVPQSCPLEVSGTDPGQSLPEKTCRCRQLVLTHFQTRRCHYLANSPLAHSGQHHKQQIPPTRRG